MNIFRMNNKDIDINLTSKKLNGFFFKFYDGLNMFMFEFSMLIFEFAVTMAKNCSVRSIHFLPECHYVCSLSETSFTALCCSRLSLYIRTKYRTQNFSRHRKGFL